LKVLLNEIDRPCIANCPITTEINKKNVTKIDENEKMTIKSKLLRKIRARLE